MSKQTYHISYGWDQYLGVAEHLSRNTYLSYPVCTSAESLRRDRQVIYAQPSRQLVFIHSYETGGGREMGG
jgi:hypothetical protein